MEIFNISIDSFYLIVIKLNWIAFITLCVLLFLISWLYKKVITKVHKHSIEIQEITLGIGNSSLKIKYDNRDRAIAYKLWVELNTRKIGLEFDTENDVIDEVYNSWYEYFRIARELIKELPVNKIESTPELIELVTNVLNNGLRPHLTKWQARYRRWYSVAIKSNSTEEPPQDIQKKYPHYRELVDDLIKTNKQMIAYKDLMYKIAFNKT